MITESDILNASILIVDDQETNVRLLHQLLIGAGYTRIASLTTSSDVGALYRLNNYDLILLDLEMPGMDGFAVMKDLQKSTDDTYLPVLVVTAQPGHKLRALQSGARDFISKPFDLVEIKARIRNILEVRLLYKKLADYNKRLEQTVREQTAELRDSEARYRSLTELASDWYWEQDDKGSFTKISGPVLEMLGYQKSSFTGAINEDIAAWNKAERTVLQNKIASRQPFQGLAFSRMTPDGQQQRFQVNGEPMFNHLGRFEGYRGVAVELMVQEFPAKPGKPIK